MRASDALLPANFDLLQETGGATGAPTGTPTGDQAATGAPAGSEGQAPPQGGLGNFMVPMLLILAVFWFVMIGPERKNRKKREEMLGALKKGDKVMTTSGIYGSVAQVQDGIVTVQIADGVRVRMSVAAIQGLEETRSRDDAAAKSTKT